MTGGTTTVAQTGEGLSILAQSASDVNQKKTIDVLQQIITDEQAMAPITSLAQFRPFPLMNNEHAIIVLKDASIFRSFPTWEDFFGLLKEEFASKTIKSVLYSVKSKPDDYAYTLRPQLFDDLKRLWLLEKTVAKNHAVREEERIAFEAEQAAEKERKEKRKAERADERARKREERRAAGEDVDEEEEENPEEEEEEEEGPKMSRKEREAFEKEKKRKKKEEKERTKREAQEEKELKEVKFQLVRFVELYAVSVQFE